MTFNSFCYKTSLDYAASVPETRRE